MQPWKKLSSKYVYDAMPYFHLRQDTCELPDTHTVIDDYYVMETSDVVLVFALTTENQVLLVEQYKHGAEQFLLELPGGLCDSADIVQEARRELREETGYDSADIQLMRSVIHDPTRSNRRIHLFFARDAHKVAEQSLDTTENILVHTMTVPALRHALSDGQIQAVDSIAAIYTALQHLSDGLSLNP